MVEEKILDKDELRIRSVQCELDELVRVYNFGGKTENFKGVVYSVVRVHIQRRARSQREIIDYINYWDSAKAIPAQ